MLLTFQHMLRDTKMVEPSLKEKDFRSVLMRCIAGVAALTLVIGCTTMAEMESSGPTSIYEVKMTINETRDCMFRQSTVWMGEPVKVAPIGSSYRFYRRASPTFADVTPVGPDTSTILLYGPLFTRPAKQCAGLTPMQDKPMF